MMGNNAARSPGSQSKRLSVASMCLATGLLLPFLTGQIPQIGMMLLPMHLPVLLCGFICGWKWGLVVGAILPPLRFVLFGMPPIYPTGVAMMFELATYGAVAGFLYGRSRWQCLLALYKCLIVAMLAGRAVLAVAEMVLLGFGAEGFTWTFFLTETFVTGFPGIVLQLVAVPAIMAALNRTGLVPYHRAKEKPGEMRVA